MTRVGVLLALPLGATLFSEAAAATKPGFGVFATINGKKFKAVSTGEADDPCIGGFYQAGGGVVFTAGECRTARGRRIARRNFKQVVFDCGVINPPAPTPPFETPCLAAGYAEARTKHRIPVFTKMWGFERHLRGRSWGNLDSPQWRELEN